MAEHTDDWGLHRGDQQHYQHQQVDITAVSLRNPLTPSGAFVS
jgi:hypothetical protein